MIPPTPSPLGADDPVERLTGIGPKTAASLAELGIRRVGDILFHLPRRYEDRGSVVTIDEACRSRSAVLLYGRLSLRSARYVRRRLHISDGSLEDGTGRIAIRWFNQPWMAERLEEEAEAFVYGVVSEGKTGKIQLVNPEIEFVPRSAPVDVVVPIYPRLGPLTGKRLRKIMDQALTTSGVVDPIPESLRRELALIGLSNALETLHRPDVPDDDEGRERLVSSLNAGSSPGHRRLAFDELLAVSLVVARHRAQRLASTARPIVAGPDFDRDCSRILPFELTAGQRRVVDEVLRDLTRPVPMARLLQGDVGCGKTAVAILAILAAVAGGRQVALMAPTELLAEQLHRSVAGALSAVGHEVELLTGSLKPGRARSVGSRLSSGDLDVVVGTHALFQTSVVFADLGLVVIDEQHRFGVAQRQRLLDKGDSPHLLVMTATPIPRSLALTLYGDLDLSIIDELPPGRSPVRTEIRDATARPRILRFLRSEIDAGGQGFIVYPLIESSAKIEAEALEAHEAEIGRALGGLEIGVLHGRLVSDEREAVAERFRRGELKVVLATTVIEVGVDVPAATVMIVESADRFGLSQLHQLRGRVGRGSRRSWCILVTGDEPSEGAERRLRVLERTTDGFEVAEADLRHRGPGEITGHRQWGAEGLRFADLVRHHDLAAQSRSVARRLADSPEYSEIRDRLLGYHPVGGEFKVG